MRKAPDKKVTILLQQDKDDMMSPSDKDLKMIRELLQQQSNRDKSVRCRVR